MTLTKEPHLIKWTKVSFYHAIHHAKRREILTVITGWVNNQRQGEIIEFSDGSYLGCYSDWDQESEAKFGDLITIELPCQFFIGE